MRFLIGILVTLGLIILIIVLLLSGRGNDTATPTVKPLNVTTYATSDSSAQLLIDGPIVANQKHYTTKITINQNQALAELYQGYPLENPIRTISYENNQTAYAVFLHALQHQGFALYNTDAPHDERGYCPSGLRYIIRFENEGKELRRSWTTSCGSSIKHSFGGASIGPISQLFKAQVPEYNKLVAGTNL